MIPLSVPYLNGNEWKYVKECLDTGWISSAGTYVTKFEEMIAEFAGAKYGVACMNGTVGLHIAQLVCGIGENDLVLAPNLTFIATLNAIKYSGAQPILVDIDPTSWQMDPELIKSFLQNETIEKNGSFFHKTSGKRVAAIMPVHVLGNIGQLDELLSIAKDYNLRIIEDTTEALGSSYKGKHAGSFGELGVFSFNGNKIISTGGGGVIVTNDESLAQKAKHLTTQAKTSAMEYIHDEIGYNYRLVNVLAAIGVAQMETFPDTLKRKRFMDAYYREHLAGIGDIVFQTVSAEVEANCWLFTFKTNHMRGLLEYLNNNRVQSRPFWKPMNRLDMFTEEIYLSDKDHANEVYENSISIPSSAGITESELKTVVETIKKYYSTI